MTLWQNSLDRGEFVGSILMDLLKDYDCLKDFLCFSELQTCGFKILFLSYLTNRTQRIKRGSTFSDLTNIVKSILQRAILGPLLLNILINYLFFFSAKCQICSFVYDNSLYCVYEFRQHILWPYTKCKTYMNGLFTIHMKADPDKFQLLS